MAVAPSTLAKAVGLTRNSGTRDVATAKLRPGISKPNAGFDKVNSDGADPGGPNNSLVSMPAAMVATPLAPPLCRQVTVTVPGAPVGSCARALPFSNSRRTFSVRGSARRVVRFTLRNWVNPANKPSGNSVVIWLFRSSITLTAVKPANTPAGSAVNSLLARVRSVSAPRPANTPAGRVARSLLGKFNSVSAPRSANSPAGSVTSPFWFKSSSVNALKPANTPGGNVVSWRLSASCRKVSAPSPAKMSGGNSVMAEPTIAKWVSPPSPAKSPLRSVTLLRDKSVLSMRVIARNCAGVMAAQSAAPVLRTSMSRTAGVRRQAVVVWRSMVNSVTIASLSASSAAYLRVYGKVASGSVANGSKKGKPDKTRVAGLKETPSMEEKPSLGIEYANSPLPPAARGRVTAKYCPVM